MKAALIKKAEIYGIAALLGISVLPVSITSTVISKASVQQLIDVRFDRAYEVSLGVMKNMGKISVDDKPNGAINAHIGGALVALRLKKTADNKTEITISARKFMFPKLDIAGGVLYQILDKLQ
jgi:hypothetical protein